MFTGDRSASRLPLARYEISHSSDAEHVREAFSRVFRSHRLEVVGRDVGLDARVRSARLRDVSVSVISYGCDVRVDSDPTDTFFAVLIPLTGEAEVRCGVERVQSSVHRACVLSPSGSVRLLWPADCVQLVVRMERASVEACLSDLLGASVREPLRFAPAMDLGSGYGRSWRRGLDLLIAELDRPGSLLEKRAVSDMFERTLMTALLMGHASNYTRMLDGEVSTAPNRAVSIALEWMDNHPKWQHTTASLAREARVTERCLQQGFRKHLNMGPMEYLRGIRLRRVRDQLRAAQADAVTVSEVAAQWGFLHAGHFAAHYLRRFGERPSDTLRR